MSNDTRDVKLTKIILDYSKQVRVAIDYDVVREYAEKMAAGKVLPPIDLFRAPVESAGFLIGDGWHRILAAKENKADLIAARIHDGDPNEALKFALGANQEHGIRRTNADKRNAVELALQVFGNMSDRQIALIQ